MEPDLVRLMVENFPNLLGFIILGVVLYRSDQNSERRYEEQVVYLRTLLDNCLQDSQGREAFSEGKLKTLDDLVK